MCITGAKKYFKDHNYFDIKIDGKFYNYIKFLEFFSRASIMVELLSKAAKLQRGRGGEEPRPWVFTKGEGEADGEDEREKD